MEEKIANGVTGFDDGSSKQEGLGNHTPTEYRWSVAQSSWNIAQSLWKVAQPWDSVLLLFLACWVLFAQLGSPLMEPDESRYAEIPRLMLRSGDWITPRLQGKPYNDKPPLVYWLIAASYAVFGVSIEAARLVPATAGLLTLIAVYLWSRHTWAARLPMSLC